MAAINGTRKVRQTSVASRKALESETVTYGFATAVHSDPLAAMRATAREITGRSFDAV
jgi:hypothetical protein